MLVLIDNWFPWFGDMMELGGEILLLIIILAAVMWTLILERVFFFRFVYPKEKNQAVALWAKRDNKSSWTSQRLRQLLIQRVIQSSSRNLALIMTLVKVCPLLGLLGTVLGMLEIFDALAITGNNSARSTAGGVSKATVSTMAGMVVAISGLMVSNHLMKKASLLKQALQKGLPLGGAKVKLSRGKNKHA